MGGRDSFTEKFPHTYFLCLYQHFHLHSYSCTGWINSPVTSSTPISRSSVTFLQSYPSYRYSFLLRILFLRTSSEEEYILRRCVEERVETCGIGWICTLEEKDTPFRGVGCLMLSFSSSIVNEEDGSTLSSSSSLSLSLSELGTRTRPGIAGVKLLSSCCSEVVAPTNPNSHDPPP